MSETTSETTPETESTAVDRPVNGLNPNIPTPEQQRRLPLIVKIYGVLCLVIGVVSVPLLAIFYTLILLAVFTNPEYSLANYDPTLTVIVGVVGAILALVGSVGLIYLGWSLFKDRRRNAAIWAYALVVVTLGQLLCDIMLDGMGTELIRPAVQLAILLALSATVDPSLKQERELERRLSDLQDRAAARS